MPTCGNRRPHDVGNACRPRPRLALRVCVDDGLGLLVELGTEISAQAVGLADDPRRLLEAPVRMKLFFHSEIEGRYAEVFLNVDVPGRVVQFHEKDQEYRQNVVRALRERA